jgi:hypothetical protein
MRDRGPGDPMLTQPAARSRPASRAPSRREPRRTDPPARQGLMTCGHPGNAPILPRRGRGNGGHAHRGAKAVCLVHPAAVSDQQPCGAGRSRDQPTPPAPAGPRPRGPPNPPLQPPDREVYVAWIRRYIVFHGKRHPAEMAAPEITAFLTALAVKGRVAASTQNQALSALLFLYRQVLEQDVPWLDDMVRAKRPERLPVVLTRDEVRALLDALEGGPSPHGLSALRRRPPPARMLPPARPGRRLRDEPADRARRQGRQGPRHDAPRRRQARSRPSPPGGPRAAPPGPRARGGRGRAADRADQKVPERGTRMGLAVDLPGHTVLRRPLTGQRRRHHLHESVLQRAVKDAVRAAGIAKRAGPTPCATPSRPTCWRTVTTSAPSRRCRATATSARR